jgi:hypothetical protein
MWVCEVAPGEEVLILDIGVHIDTDEPSATRLRLKVSTCATDALASDDAELVVGWMSAETGAGDMLLDPINLLGIDAVKMHSGKVLNSSMGGSAMQRASTRISQQGGAQADNMLDAIPWKVGGQYRLLEKIDVRDTSQLKSKKLGNLPPGAIVTVSDLKMMEDVQLGLCPVAYINASSDTAKLKLQARRGWIRCAGKDGRNLIDERDQLEFEKVSAKLRDRPPKVHHHHATHSSTLTKKVQISTNPPQEREIAPRHDEGEHDDDNDQDDWEDSSEESWESEEEETDEGESLYEEPSPRTAEKLPAAIASKEEASSAKASKRDAEAKEAEFAKKLQAMEIGAKEEKLVDDKTILTDQQWCGCSCGATK